MLEVVFNVPYFKSYLIGQLKYVSFDVKALRVKVVVFCSVIPYSLVDASISQEPASSIVMVEETEHLCSMYKHRSCYMVLGCLNYEDKKVALIVGGSQRGEYCCLKRCDI
jgi:hypothetical protein